MTLLRDIETALVARRPQICCQLSKFLFKVGIEYHEYAAVFSEQGLRVHDNVIEHFYSCDICVTSFGPDIRGARYICLDCIASDLCADCYTSWKASNGEMEHCKGHTFYQIPRPCWYQLEKGAVMEDGSTLDQVIDLLKKRFTWLLESTKVGTDIKPSCGQDWFLIETA